MEHGTILLPVSIAEQPLAVPVDTALRITVIIAIPPVRGASTAIPSTAEARLVPAAAHPPTTMLTIRIATVRGCRTAKRSTSVPKRARPAAILAMNTLTTLTQTATASATIAVRPSV